MIIPSVEDIEPVHPLNLDDEAEDLPAYEESVSSGLSGWDEDSAQSLSRASTSYRTWGQLTVQVEDTARNRLNEKERLGGSMMEKAQHAATSPTESTATSMSHAPSPVLPSYQDSLSATFSSPRDPLANNLARKYAISGSSHTTELTRTGLARVDFGSRFITHSNETITSALSLYGGSLVLFGTADGLKVADLTKETPIRTVWSGLPIWDMKVLRRVEDPGKTPRGSVVLLCGGREDAARPGRPKAKGGQVQLRVWRLGSLASLARWTAGQEMDWPGVDLGQPRSKKGKEKSSMFSFKKGSPATDTPTDSLRVSNAPNISLAKAWAADCIKLEPTTNGQSADILDFSLRQQGECLYVAIATPSHILLHIGVIIPGGVSFRSTRQFYLPFAPFTIGLLEVSTPSGDISLGIWVSFGSLASVIRNSDSAVLDFKPPSGQGAGKGGGEWTDMQNIWKGGKEVYAFYRGNETIIYPSPLRLPIASPPVIHTTWPRKPLSSLVVPDGDDLLLMTTSGVGEICTQRAKAMGQGYQLDLQDGTHIGEGRILPLAWGHIRDGVYANVKERKEWRICAIEKM